MLRELIRRVYEANLTRWTRFWLRRTGKLEDALDIIHDAIARTLDAGPALQTEAQAVAYLWRVMRTTSAPAITRPKEKLHRQELSEDFHLIDAAASPVEILLSSEDKATRKRMLKLARKHLKELPGPTRQCVKLNVFRQPGMTLREIAPKLGIGKSTVKDHVDKGLDIIVTAVMEELGYPSNRS